MELPFYSSSFPSRTIPCCSADGAVVVVYVDNGFAWQFSRGEYSTGISPTAAVDPVAVKAVQVPGQRKHDRTLRLELDYNPCGTSFRSVTVLHESG